MGSTTRPWSRVAAVTLWVCTALVAAAQVAGAFRRPALDRLADLHVYVGAVRLLLDGGSLYDFAAHNGAPFTYPPVAGLIFLPMGLLPEQVLRTVWTIATVAVVTVLALLARRHACDPGRPWALPAVALLLFASAPISSNIRFGQISVFLVVVVVVDGLAVLPPRYRGLATGVATAIKLTPAIFIPYWWFAGQRRTAVNATAGFLAATVLGWLVLPRESVRFWLTEIWNVERVGNIATGGNQSLNGALLRLELPDTARMVVVAVVGGAVAVVALARAVRVHRAGEPFTALVIVGAAALVLSPVSWTHHQVWLVLAAVLTVSSRPARNLAWSATVAVIMVVPVTSIAAQLPGGVLTGNARLLLAVAVACLVPFRPPPPRSPPGPRPGPVSAHPARV